MPLLNLPTELLLLIGSFVDDDEPTLHALCLTSRRLRSIFTSVLYDNEPFQPVVDSDFGARALHFALLHCQNDTLAYCLASRHFKLMTLELSGRCQSRSDLILLPARMGNRTAINMLVECGVSIEHPEDFPPYRKRKQKRRPLELAFGRPNENKVVDPMVALTLVECGARMDGLWKQGSALHFAALHGFPSVVRACLARGASVEQRNRYGDTPLHCALRLMFRERELMATLEVLLEHEADVNALDREGRSVMETAHNRSADRERLPDGCKVAKEYRYRAVLDEHDVKWLRKRALVANSADMDLALEEEDREVVWNFLLSSKSMLRVRRAMDMEG